jgi:hypothetical protein
LALPCMAAFLCSGSTASRLIPPAPQVVSCPFFTRYSSYFTSMFFLSSTGAPNGRLLLCSPAQIRNLEDRKGSKTPAPRLLLTTTPTSQQLGPNLSTALPCSPWISPPLSLSLCLSLSTVSTLSTQPRCCRFPPPAQQRTSSCTPILVVARAMPRVWWQTHAQGKNIIPPPLLSRTPLPRSTTLQLQLSHLILCVGRGGVQACSLGEGLSE